MRSLFRVFIITLAVVVHLTSSTSAPTNNPTGNPTSNPTKNPTANPTSNPTSTPTTSSPSSSPTMGPTSCKNAVRGFELQEVGRSGKVDLYPLCKGRKESIRITIESITEVDSAGKATSNVIQNFANAGNWVKKREDYVDENGKSYPASSFTFTANQVHIGNKGKNSVQIDFVLKVWLFFQRSVVKVSNTSCGSETCTMTLDQNAIKYDVEFSSWPFADSANKLEMVVSTMEKGSGKRGSNAASKSKGMTQTTFGGYLVVQSPSRYFTGPANDETECQTAGGCVSVGNPSGRSGNDSVVDMKYTFDAWNASLRMRYDPGVDQPGSPAATTTMQATQPTTTTQMTTAKPGTATRCYSTALVGLVVWLGVVMVV